MKKIFLFSLIVITLLWCGLMLAQESSLVTDPKAKVVTQFLNPDAECTGAGELIYDDGTFEDGFGWNSTVTDGRIVTLFTPHSYPWQFNTFCLALTRLAAGTPNFTFDIVMYDNTGAGGTPGNQIGIVAGVNAIDIPIWTTLAFYDFDITSMPPLASGSVYIGIKYNPSLVASPHFSLVDQTPTTPLHPGYVKSDGTLWQPIQSILPGSKAISYRTLGSSNCPVDPASNPDPPNGATGLPLTGNTLSWTNGAGTTNVELWFGPVSTVVKVYDGTAITSWATPSLNYQTTYQWKVVCKNDTCGTQGSTWSFTTMQDPNLIEYCDEFDNLNNWTIIGPLGTTNWSASGSSSAGGTPPELQMAWSPSFNGESKIRSVIIPFQNNISVYYSFNFYFDWYADPSGTVTIGITYDGGATSTTFYSLIDPTGNVGPTLISGQFYTPSSGSQNAQIEITFSGNSFNNDNIYWDDLCLWPGFPVYPPNPPSNLTAQVIFNPNPQVQLGWQDNSWNESGFNMLRKNGQPNDPGDYVLVGTVGQNQTQYIDATVIPESTYTYRAFAYNQFGQNGSNTATIAVPVPVELISFTAEVEENVVTLFWQTATETNNSGFEILRSAQNDNVGWERIGFVEGKGTTTEIQSYSFTDKPEPGIYKYRLKQIDFDGTFAYSPEVEAEVKAPNVFSLEQNYPNPFNPTTKIKYTIPEDARSEKQEVILKVYDVLGNEIATLINESKTAGSYEVEFNPSSHSGEVRNLPSGIYFYQLQTGQFIETKKMVLMK